MSDFKNISDFRKAKSSKFQYQDPTYLSFVILFDFIDKINSPFLSQTAEDYLKKLADVDEYYGEKLEALQNFKKALKTINNEMPWYWQQLSGLEKIQAYDPIKPYRGGDDAKLTITTLESINLPITGLMHLYRKATFDERKHSWVLPENLRKFRMYVYVTEIRTIQSVSSLNLTGVSATEFKPKIGASDKNANISGQTARPYFMFGLKFCEFDLMSANEAFTDLKKSPDEAAMGSIVISYQAVQSIEARVLNGIVETKYNTDKLSPSPDSENNTVDGLLDLAKQQAANATKELADRAITDLRTQSLERMSEIQAQLKRETIGRGRAALNNIYADYVRGIDGSNTAEAQTQNIGAAINSNVYGLTEGNNTIGGALGAAAANSLGNVYG